MQRMNILRIYLFIHLSMNLCIYLSIYDHMYVHMYVVPTYKCLVRTRKSFLRICGRIYVAYAAVFSRIHADVSHMSFAFWIHAGCGRFFQSAYAENTLIYLQKYATVKIFRYSWKLEIPSAVKITGIEHQLTSKIPAAINKT